MKQALIEYGEVLKVEGKWICKHWKGYALFTAVCGLIPIIVLNFDDITDFVKGKMSRTKKETES